MKAKSKKGQVSSELVSAQKTVEQRVEIANKMLEEFKSKVNSECGLAMDVEIIAHRKGILPRMVWIDTTVKPDEAEIK